MRLTSKQVKRLVREELDRLSEVGPQRHNVAKIEALEILENENVELDMRQLISTLVNEMSDQGYGDPDLLHTEVSNALYDSVEMLLQGYANKTLNPVRQFDDEQY